jgi:hypothetical protein
MADADAMLIRKLIVAAGEGGDARPIRPPDWWTGPTRLFSRHSEAGDDRT